MLTPRNAQFRVQILVSIGIFLVFFSLVALVLSTSTIKTGVYPGASSWSNQRKCARTSTGNLWCVYYRSDGSLDQIYAAVSTDGGVTWTETAVTSGSYIQRYPAIAVDGNDHLHIVWYGENSDHPSNYQIRYRKYDSSTDTWGPIQELTSGNYNQFEPVAAVDSSDNIHVVWYGFHSGSPVYEQIRYRKYDSSTDTWGPIQELTSGNYAQFHPSVAIDSGDNIYVVWGGIPPAGANEQIRYRKYDSSTDTWQPTQEITSADNHQYFPSIAIDSNDHVHVVWYNSLSGGPNQIRYRKYDSGTDTWQPVEDLTAEVYGQRNPSLGVDSNNNLYVAWDASPAGGFYKIRYRKYDSSTDTWQPVEDLIADNTDNNYPNFLWANWPMVGGVRTNVPDTGYAFVWTNGTINKKISYYTSSDLSWPAVEDKPDIIVSDVIWEPATVTDEDSVLLSYKIKNIGTAKGSDPPQFTFRMNCYIDDVGVGYNFYGVALGPGEEVESACFMGDQILDPGSHTVKVVADVNDWFDELNEGNNERTETLQVIEAPPPQFSSFTVEPPNPGTGDTVSISTVASDPVGHYIELYACKSEGASPSGCDGDTWCSSNQVVSNPGCTFTAPNSPGSYNVYAYVYDTYPIGRGATNNPMQGSFQVTQDQPPAFFDININPANPDPGDTITVSAIASDPDGDQVILYACKTAGATPAGCSGGTWCSSGYVSSNPVCNFNAPTSEGVYEIYAYIFDQNGNSANENPTQGSFQVSEVGPAENVWVQNTTEDWNAGVHFNTTAENDDLMLKRDKTVPVVKKLDPGFYGASCVTHNSKVLCFGGISPSGVRNKVIMYDPAQNEVYDWGNAFPGGVSPNGRAFLSCVPYNNYVYCFGGNNGVVDLSHIIQYDPNNHESQIVNSLPDLISGLSCVPIDSRIYCFYNGQYDVIEYRPPPDNAIITHPFPSFEVSNHVSCSESNEYIYCFDSVHNPLIEFDPDPDIPNYNYLSGIPGYISDSSCNTLNAGLSAENIYCTGGNYLLNGTVVNSITEYDSLSNTFTPADRVMPSPVKHTSCAFVDETLYCFGGQSESGAILDTVTAYNPYSVYPSNFFKTGSFKSQYKDFNERVSFDHLSFYATIPLNQQIKVRIYSDIDDNGFDAGDDYDELTFTNTNNPTPFTTQFIMPLSLLDGYRTYVQIYFESDGYDTPIFHNFSLYYSPSPLEQGDCALNEVRLFSLAKSEDSHLFESDHNIDVCFPNSKIISAKIKEQCDMDERAVLALGKRNNAHVGTVGDYTIAPYRLCIKPAPGVSMEVILKEYNNPCEGCDFLLRMPYLANSHAGLSSYNVQYALYLNFSNTKPMVHLELGHGTNPYDLTIEANMSEYDPDGTIISCDINWEDGNIDPVTPQPGVHTITHTYGSTSEYLVTYSCEDNDGNVGYDQKSIIVTHNSPPSVSISLSHGASNQDRQVEAEIFELDPEGDGIVCSIDWGDGVVEPTIVYNDTHFKEHIYSTDGTYTATYTCNDSKDQTNKAEDSITVSLLDTEKPLIMIVSIEPALLEGKYANQKPLIVKGYASDNDKVSRLEYVFDSGPPTPLPCKDGACDSNVENFEFELDPSQGQHVLIINATDASWNYNSTNKVFTYDETPPTILCENCIAQEESEGVSRITFSPMIENVFPLDINESPLRVMYACETPTCNRIFCNSNSPQCEVVVASHWGTDCVYAKERAWIKAEDKADNTARIFAGKFAIRKGRGCPCKYDEECVSNLCKGDIFPICIENTPPRMYYNSTEQQ